MWSDELLEFGYERLEALKRLCVEADKRKSVKACKGCQFFVIGCWLELVRIWVVMGFFICLGLLNVSGWKPDFSIAHQVITTAG
jgi:hypothetical protein